MTALEHSQWKAGFPFSPSTIRAGRRLQVDGVNAPFIPEAHEHPAAPPAVAPPGDNPMPAVMQPALRGAHPVGRQSGMRLVPLEAFVWGSRSNPSQPRTRPDHVLIWVNEGRTQLDFRATASVCAPTTCATSLREPPSRPRPQAGQGGMSR